MNPLNHVAIIMDGNGRWGLRHKNSRNAGHKAGLKTIEKIIKESVNNKLRYLLSPTTGLNHIDVEGFKKNRVINKGSNNTHNITISPRRALCFSFANRAIAKIIIPLFKLKTTP